jgi:hypothetical protein
MVSVFLPPAAWPCNTYVYLSFSSTLLWSFRSITLASGLIGCDCCFVSLTSRTGPGRQEQSKRSGRCVSSAREGGDERTTVREASLVGATTMALSTPIGLLRLPAIAGSNPSSCGEHPHSQIDGPNLWRVPLSSCVLLFMFRVNKL